MSGATRPYKVVVEITANEVVKYVEDSGGKRLALMSQGRQTDHSWRGQRLAKTEVGEFRGVDDTGTLYALVDELRCLDLADLLAEIRQPQDEEVCQ